MIRSIITLLFSLGRKDGFGAKNKKGALVPRWDESACFRGATHFQRPAGWPSFCLLLREGDRARLRARWWDCLRPLLAVGRLQPKASLSVRRCWGLLMTRRGGERNNSIPQWGKSQPFSPVFAEKRGGISRTRPAASPVILSAAKDPSPRPFKQQKAMGQCVVWRAGSSRPTQREAVISISSVKHIVRSLLIRHLLRKCHLPPGEG